GLFRPACHATPRRGPRDVSTVQPDRRRHDGRAKRVPRGGHREALTANPRTRAPNPPIDSGLLAALVDPDGLMPRWMYRSGRIMTGVPRDLPSGTVTLLFTDIESSTRLLAELGPEAYAKALAEHRRRLREAFVRRAG